MPLIGASGTASAAPKSKAPAPAVSSFTASPSALAASGGTVVLRDVVTGATSCSVSSTPALAGLPATLPCASGTRTVVVPANTGSKTEKYKLTLSATGSKTVKAKATLTVAPAPPPSISAFSASPPSLPHAGGSVTLSAKVSGASSCVVSSSPTLAGLPKTLSCASGLSTTLSVPANPSAKAQTYKLTLEALGSKKVKAPKLTLTVAGASGPGISTFVATPASLGAAGGMVVLSATVTDVTSCTFSSTPAITGLPATVSCSGGLAMKSVSIPANTGSSRTYTFSVSAVDKKTTVKATPVKVAEAAPGPPSIASFNATPGVLTSAGGSVQLAASVTGAGTCTFSSLPAIAGLPTTVACSSGNPQVDVTVPANTTTSQVGYVFSLTATGTTSVNASPVVVDEAPAGPPPIVDVSGTLSASTTWSPVLAESYVIQGSLDVPAGVTLTIDPGTVVKSLGAEGYSPELTVEGTLRAVGTAASPIV
ncbi:MAG TPA: hypothetical protein VMB72_01320, partial [Acidimicrobiales bacterium]|nr:hypothetical protein [Acidimicrobiales bacterium]